MTLIYSDIDKFVTTTHDTVNVLLGYKNGGDALLLYFRYIQQRKQQQNNQTLSSTRFMLNATGRGQERFNKAKKILLDKGFIDDITIKDDDGKIKGWYVKVNFVINTGVSEMDTGVSENQGVENPVSGEQIQNTSVTKENTSVTKEKNKREKIKDFEQFKSKIDLSFYKEIYNEQDLMIEMKCCFDHHLENTGGVVIATTAFNNRVKRGIKFGNIRTKPKELPKDNSHIKNIYDLSHLQGQI